MRMLLRAGGALLLLLLLLAICGCGGSSDEKPTQKVSQVIFNFVWPQAMLAPSSRAVANWSIVVTFAGQTRAVNLPVASVLYTGVPLGDQAYTVRLYNQSNGAGTLLAELSGSVKVLAIDQNQQTITLDVKLATLLKIASASTTVEIKKTLPLLLSATADDSPVLFPQDSVAWSSSNSNIASVNTNGVVTGVSAGTATITATFIGTNLQKSIDITVVEATTGQVAVNVIWGTTTRVRSAKVLLDAEEEILSAPAAMLFFDGVVPGVHTLTAHFYSGTNGTGTEAATYTTSVTALAGNTVLTKVYATLSAAASLNINAQVLKIEKRETTQVMATALTSNGAPVLLFPGDIKWTSSNTSVATVNATSGLVTGTGEGTAVITATLVGTALTKSLTFTVINPNMAPVAAFTTSLSPWIINTGITFNASGSSDAEDATSALQVRWDWDGDGTYDTAFSPTKSVSHTFVSAGSVTVVLQVLDTDGKTATAQHTLNVKGTITLPVKTATMSVTAARTFSATVAGYANNQVNWDVQEVNGGSITSGGVYTAPTTAGTYHIIASSASDSSLSAMITVTVQSSSGTITIN